MAQQIQLRRGTAAAATSANPTLAEGELGLETDTGRFKIGDGVTAWNSLAYANSIPTGGSTGQALIKQSGTDYDFDWGDVFSVDVTGSDHKLTRTMLIDCGATYVDKGNSGTSTQTYDYTAGSHQKSTATGNHTIAFSNFPPSGNLGAILIEGVNFGAFTITWPTANFIKPDGTTTTSVSTWLAAWTGRTAFQTSGTDWLKVWSRDGGTTLYIGWAA